MTNTSAPHNPLRGEDHPKTQHSDAVVERARVMRDQGFSYGRISQSLGVPYYTVRDWTTYRTR